MPLRYRHLGFSLSVSCQWLMAFVTVFAGPIAIADPRVGWKTWIWFLVFNAIAVPFGKHTIFLPKAPPSLSLTPSAVLYCYTTYVWRGGSLLIAFAVYFYCPETRGSSLEEIDLLFLSGSLGETDAARTLKHEAPLEYEDTKASPAESI